MSHAAMEPRGESPLHEQSSISLRALVIFFIWFFVGLAVIEAFVYGMYRAFHHGAGFVDVPITGLTDERVTRQIPPDPRLQPSVDHNALPREDLDAMHARDMEEFRRRPGWVDEKTGEVHVSDAIAAQVIQMTLPENRRKQ
jgi:hypothetical protein